MELLTFICARVIALHLQRGCVLAVSQVSYSVEEEEDVEPEGSGAHLGSHGDPLCSIDRAREERKTTEPYMAS